MFTTVVKVKSLLIKKVEYLSYENLVYNKAIYFLPKMRFKPRSQKPIANLANFSSISTPLFVLAACNGNSSPEIGETFYATKGNATIMGGPGEDTVSYSGITIAIEADLTESSQQVTFGNSTHTLLDIEHIVGTEFNDIISNSLADSIITGGGGCDTFIITWGLARITDLETCDIFIVDNGALFLSKYCMLHIYMYICNICNICDFSFI